MLDKQKIIEIILSACALGENHADVNTKLCELSLDSLSFVSVIVKLENEFGIEFDTDDLNIGKWETVQDIITATEEKLYEKA